MRRAVRLRSASKYHARPCVVDGIRFASVKESQRYSELKLLEKAGQIRCLVLQPAYSLAIRPLASNGLPISCGEYRGDFQYEDVATGMKVIEDCKGIRLPLYKLKKKIVEALYGITITET